MARAIIAAQPTFEHKTFKAMNAQHADAGEIVIAVSKGRILEDTMPLLARAGIEVDASDLASRRLIMPTSAADVRLLIVRATDVPTYVEYGAADLGVSGRDVFIEHGADATYQPLDLGIAACRMMVAGREGTRLEDFPRPRVATKYVKTAQRYFAERGTQAEIIKLYGSMELAPLVGLADLIVDLVDTGNTLRANGLVPMAEVYAVTSWLVANKAAMKTKRVRMNQIIDAMADAAGDARAAG